MTVCCVAIIYRYPIDFGHELSSDTTFIHSLTGSLLSAGRAAWILHPTSYLGLYALSYPSAMPFVFGALSALGGLPIEGSLLLTGFVFAIVGSLGAFAASRAGKADDRLALLASLLFTIAPFYLKDTTWVGSSRGFVTALVPMVILLLLRHLRTADVRYLVLTVVVVGAMTAIHRMGILALFVLIAYGFAIPLHRITQRIRFALSRVEAPFRFVSTGTALSAFFVLFYVQFLFPGIAGADIVEEYGGGVLFNGTSFPVLLANMIASLVGKVGILFPLAVIGLARFTWARPKEGSDKFLLVTILIMIPLLSLRDYIAEFLIFVFVLLIVLALFPRRQSLSGRKVAATALVITVVTSGMAFAWVAKDYWRTRYYTDAEIPNELYSVATYLRLETNGTILANEGLSAGRIAAISGRPTLPVGGASIHWFSPQQLTFGFVRGNQVFVSQVPITSLTFNTDEIFTPVGVPNAKDDYETMFYHQLYEREAQTMLNRYGVHYVVLFHEDLNQFQSYIWRPSPFVADVKGQTYNVFDVPSYSVWFVR